MPPVLKLNEPLDSFLPQLFFHIWNISEWKRHRSKTARIATNEQTQLHSPPRRWRHRRSPFLRGNQTPQIFADVLTAAIVGTRGRFGLTIIKWHNSRTMVVWTFSKHDLFAEKQSSLLVAPQRRPNATTQILHQKGKFTDKTRK